MKPNFHQKVVIIVYMLTLIILCFFFVPFGIDKIKFDSIFSTKGHLVTLRFLTEIIVFTLPAIILYKTSVNLKDPNYSLFELFSFKTKKSYWLYTIIVLFIGIASLYIRNNNIKEEQKEKLNMEADSIAKYAADYAQEDAARAQEEADSLHKAHKEKYGF